MGGLAVVGPQGAVADANMKTGNANKAKFFHVWQRPARRIA
jgi:hypothetical protein